MSSFVDMGRQLSMISRLPRFDDADLAQIGVGREIARELVAALRPGEQDPDLLASLALLVGQVPGESLRGFFRELQIVIEKAVHQ